MTTGERNGYSHEQHGAVFDNLTAVSMTVGRGGAARLVAQLANLGPSDLVVDVGCGPGTAVRRASREGARAVGVDPSGQMLRLARWIGSLRRNERVRFVEGTVESLPIVSESATVVWALSSVHHWHDQAGGLAEARRVLKSAGRLLLVERSVESGAKGHAPHGLTDDEAQELVRAVEGSCFSQVTLQARRTRLRDLVIVTAVAP